MKFFATLAASVLLVSTAWSQDPTTIFIWTGKSSNAKNKYWGDGANWVGGKAPARLSSNIYVFQGDYHPVPDNWPFFTNSLGTSILIFSNTITSSDLSIKMLAGSNNVMNFGSYVRQDSPKPIYWGCTGWVPVSTWYVTNAYFTNALGDASVGGQTEFMCTGGRLDLYGVLKDGAGAHSKLVKSGDYTLSFDGDSLLGNDSNTYTGGTFVNGAGSIKMSKLPGFFSIPGDVTVNATGANLNNNSYGGDQIAHTAIVTLNGASSFFSLGGFPYTVQTVQGTNTSAYVDTGGAGTLTVAPSSATNYAVGGLGESDFYGYVMDSGSGGALVMNGSGIYGMLGTLNSVDTLTVNSGTLKVNGNSGTAAVTVNSGGTLLGIGAIAAPVAVASGGTISAGFGAGTVSLGAGLDLSAGGTDIWELSANSASNPGTDFDQIVLTGGNLVLGGPSTLSIRFIGSATAPNASVAFWQSAHTWTIISMSGGANSPPSNFGSVQNGSYAAGSFTTSVDASGNVLLTFTPNVAPPVALLRITLITNTGPGSVTVSYTNTLPGTNYVLSYRTNLSTTNWFTAGSKTAAGTSDSQADSSVTNRQRFYRVYYSTSSVVPAAVKPRIMSITNTGPGSVTVSYANTLPGMNYVLSYGTNLSTTNWFTVGTKMAAGTSDSQMDSSATNRQRFYRVYYP